MNGLILPPVARWDACAPVARFAEADPSTFVAGLVALEQEHSAYSALSHLFMNWHPCRAELEGAFGPESRRGIFHVSSVVIDRVASCLRLDAPRMQRWLGRDVVDGVRGLPLLRPTLRYCPQCIARRCHSAVFQHRGVTHCPVHQVELRDGCPVCALPITISLPAMARSPFSCDRCGANFTSAGLHRHGDTTALPSHAFDAVRQAIRCDSSVQGSHAEFARWCELDRTLWNAPSSDLERVAARHLRWDAVGPGACPILPREQANSDDASSTGCLSLSAVMEEVHEVLAEHSLATGAPDNLHYPGTCVLHEMSVASAAFWATVNSYATIVRRGRLEPSGTRLVTGHGVLPIGAPAAAQMLLRDEFIALMACLLLSYSRLNHTAEIDWLALPAPHRYVPAWRLQLSPAATALLVRPKCRFRTLVRLIKGRGARQLLGANRRFMGGRAVVVLSGEAT